MGLFIGAGVVAFLAVVLLIPGIALESNGRRFQANKRIGKGEVVGYDHANQSDRHTLWVRIPELNDGKLYNCTSGKIDLSKYPKGTVVDILYAPDKVMGIHVIEVHLMDHPPADKSKVGRGIRVFSLVLFTAAAILTVAGILTVIL